MDPCHSRRLMHWQVEWVLKILNAVMDDFLNLRYSISYKNVCGQNSNVNGNICITFGRKLTDLIFTYLLKDIFNMEATAVFL